MKKLTILIPKIKPPEEPDIITNQLKNILFELKEQYEIKLIWIIFQSEKFDEYEYENSLVVDYHQFNNAIECIEKIKPDLIITEVRLGINGIIFAKSGNYCKIPVITITPTGESEFLSQHYSLNRIFNYSCLIKSLQILLKIKIQKNLACLDIHYIDIFS